MRVSCISFRVGLFSGDIGGSMGLFIGASMLTIVEIIDLVLSQTPIFAMEEDHKRKLAAY